MDLLQEKWKSILHHVINKHSWTGHTYFHKCCHPRLSAAQANKKKWLKPGSPAYVALEEVVLNTKLLKDLAKLTEFCHTGELEVYHALMLKYCPKREHFSFKGMLVRTQLSALDHNSNAGRQQVVARSGEHRGEARYKMSFPKAQKQWVVKPIKEKKSYGHVHDLMADVVNVCADRGIAGGAQGLPGQNLPRNIARTPIPNKQQLIQQHRSRFNT